MRNEFDKIINERFSCREFLDVDIDDNDLNFILEAGRLSPSSLGLEPWRFYVAKSKTKKEEISQIANNQKHVSECSVLIILVARLDFGEYFIDKLKSRDMSSEELEKRIQIYKPFIDSMDVGKKLAYAREQIFIALANMSNASKSIGYDTCIIGGFNNDELDLYLNLDTKLQRTAVMLTIGKCASEKKVNKIRFDKEEIIRYID